MKERGILFTPPNHRLIRDGIKIQTRRVMKTQIENLCFAGFEGTGYQPLRMDGEPIGCPYGQLGDRLYVKEGVIIHADGETLAGYYMDGVRVTNLGEKRLTAMFMAKRHARTWLDLIDVRVERLQDISEDDAIAEGIIGENVIVGANCNGGIHHEEMAMRYFFDGGYDEGYESAVEAYEHLWDSINKKTHPWKNNDRVWVLTFKKL